ncbi:MULTISPECIES: hypothetical protein [unclassified Clostridium]|uniref:hypothetical protein n=1 Tax=unclassified Clostridium TaxID=2614128 RepID=UPI0025C61E52|nr:MULTISPECIES: hypothetical protein [unclassified Clostridium]
MELVSAIVKNISKTQNMLCETLLGSAYDEYDKKYSEVYAYEIKEFLNELEDDLISIHKRFTIDSNLLAPLIITHWGCGSDECDISELYTYVDGIIKQSKSDIVIVSDNLNIDDKDKEFIKGLINEKQSKCRTILIDVRLKKDNDMTNLILHFKENDNEHYNEIINRIVSDYIRSTNLLYKMFDKKPSDYSAIASLHQAVCDSYNIDRERFLF